MKQIKQNKHSLFLAQKKKLREAGCEDYRESIKVLFSKAFGVSLDQSYKYPEHKDLDKNASLFSSMVNRRAAGEPISHIVGSRSFWKNSFNIEKTVLDPRPESELIIEITKSQLFDNMKVLDLGCGSGCIGLSLYHENPKINLFLSDFSDKALIVAKKNALELKAECKMIHSNLFSNINGKFDLIVANLPYVEKESFLHLQREIILYEPHEALYGGVYGLDIIKILLSDVGRHLNKNGMFVIEFGKGQETLITHELLRLEFSGFTFYRDLNRIKRLLCVKKDT
ncbi:MAG: peptide chain release factor N(5)-glutamine methyltransferase [Paracoccaceae bacterium]